MRNLSLDALESWRAHAARAHEYRLSERLGTMTPPEVDAAYDRLAAYDRELEAAR
jgi:hypothetical protein